ncbi:MAG: aminomethyl-transferring glycine dehydrogenase [Deltaproteobacteria bacterium]|nr:aminomethyl-transferring glycine dehydrogenase [Deltaproteobacteria bacterium]
MRYIPHTDDEIRDMLAAVGQPGIGALFETIPEKLRWTGPLEVPAALGELEVERLLEGLARSNEHAAATPWFLGAGTYAHFIPSAIDALVSRAELTTSYTPYQAEISQGTLQTIFEWQTMICALTGMEVANASMYDGASATAEAALMAMRITRKSRIAVAAGVHPHTRQVLATYLGGLDVEIETLPVGEDGRCQIPALRDDTACLILQQPSFLGTLEDLGEAAAAARAAGALLVTTVGEALSLALLRPPGDWGADIVCGEAQSFGVPMSFGGPHLGFLTTRSKFMRQMPGRLVGQTQDGAGQRGFVLTLSTREQHIRRERATSNICTNQGLCLTMATIYLALMGRSGLREVALQNLAKAEYAKARVRESAALELAHEGPTFNEFTVRVPDDGAAALARAREAGLVGGLDLAAHHPELGPAVLVCITELARREEIDRLVQALGGNAS